MRLVLVHGLATALFLYYSSALAHDIQRDSYETKHDLTASSEAQLKEIFIWGLYIQEDHKEIEKVGEWYRVIADPHRRAVNSYDRPEFREKEERYSSSGKIFCFRETNVEVKERNEVFDPNLRVRLYNKAGKVISEDTAYAHGSGSINML